MPTGNAISMTLLRQPIRYSIAGIIHNEQRQQHTDDLHQHHKAHNNSQHDVHMDHSGALPVDGLLFLAGFFFKRRFDDQRHRQQRQRTGQNAGPHRGVFLRRVCGGDRG